MIPNWLTEPAPGGRSSGGPERPAGCASHREWKHLLSQTIRSLATATGAFAGIGHRFAAAARGIEGVRFRDLMLDRADAGAVG